MTAPLLETRDLTKCYGEHVALDGLDLSIGCGEVVGLLGPNGAGKSTAIRLCLGLARPTRGTATLFGRPPSEASARRGVGYLPGELSLDGRLTGEQMLDQLGRLRGVAVPSHLRNELCERLRLSAADLQRTIRDDSRGTKQKLGLVAAFQHEPQLLILDEPTEGLDPLVREAVFELMREAGQAGRAVLHSSHVLSEVDRTASSVVMLRGGRLVASGSVADLRRSAVRRMVVGFAGEPPNSELLAAGVTIVEQDGKRVVLAVTGALDPLLAVLARHGVASLAFPEPDLAEAFSRHYAGDAEGAP